MHNRPRLLLITLLFFFAFGAWLLPSKAQRSDKPVDLSRQGSASLPTISATPVTPNRTVTSADREDDDPDLPARIRGIDIDKETYNRMRDQHVNLLRGIDPSGIYDPRSRSAAIQKLETMLPSFRISSKTLLSGSWVPLGPAPLSNGQTQQFPTTAPVSGRATAVVVDPNNPNIVYLGTAQGGVWRTLDGGANWTSIFDSAQSLAIGALALAPSNTSILYVGTGEPNNSGDSFFGVGVYRIDNANGAFVLNGPINPPFTFNTASSTITTTCFGGRAISSIIVNPIDPATIFVSTAAGIGGIGGNALANTVGPLGLRGVYRSANATSAPGSITFTKLTVNTDGSLDVPPTGNTSIFDMAIEPGNANNLLVTPSGAATGGGVWRSTNALAATPTFTNTLFPGFNGLVMKLAINKVASVVTAYVSSNEPSTKPACSAVGQAGRVRKSTDGGVTWAAPLLAAEGYCGGQCSYDNPIAVHPANANIVYIGGNARGTCSDVLKRSSDGGTTFLRDDTGLHADSHSIFFDTAATPVVWFANDGGIWKRTDSTAGTAWLNQNNAPLNTLQFQSLAVHPVDQNFTIGGTQDNGTEAQQGTAGNWISAESGDGGFALIDQSATNTTNVIMYHTFFNLRNSLIGFDRTKLGACLATKDSWEFRGAGVTADPTLSCDGTAFAAANGIVLSDFVSFYAPMALGPGTPNTFYFGTQRLYRSTDMGDTMTTVSQNPLVASTPITAIGISPQSDNVRIVGLQNGTVFATTTGSSTLTNTAFPIPTNATGSTTNRYVSRAVIDPTNSNTAYVTLAYYTNPATAGHVWRTTNLNAATPTWTSISGSGAGALPNIPVNSFAVDVNDPTLPGTSVLYAGTDIGVFSSTDGGANWAPFGTNLPRVTVFDMAIQNSFRILRIATHGRGMWEIALPGFCTLACANITQAQDANQCGAVVTYNPASGATGSCGTITCSPASGSSFPVGTTNVNCTSTAGPGCSFTVTIQDTEPPVISCPANISQSNDPNQCGAVVTYTTPTPTDNCPGATASCSPASGTFFSVGTTTVTCTATDTSPNSADSTCTFTVTVNDTQAPAITCPANIVKSNDPNQCGAVATYTTPTATDNCPGATASCSPASGSFFPVGTTTVTCTASDASPNSPNTTCTFTVKVNDTQPPVITCPPNNTAKTASINDPCVAVTFTATATDNCPGVTVVCTPPSGTCFAIGTTTVTCTATDASANTATCSFTVTVFNVCLQDDTNPGIVFLGNTVTGAYRFCCGGTVYTGVATVIKRGSTATFQHSPPDRRVQASYDETVFKGSASLQAPPGVIKCTLTDKDTRNNSCVCQ